MDSLSRPRRSRRGPDNQAIRRSSEFEAKAVNMRHTSDNIKIGQSRAEGHLYIQFFVAQVSKRAQKSSLFPSGSITRKSRILPSKS